MIEAVNFAVSNCITYVIGMQLIPIGNIYSDPTESTELGITVIEKNEQIKSWPCDRIKLKLMKLPYQCNKSIVFPILHTAV